MEKIINWKLLVYDLLRAHYIETLEDAIVLLKKRLELKSEEELSIVTLHSINYLKENKNNPKGGL